MSVPTVLIPLLRRVMPSIIANDLIGVQPMIGPVGSIFTLSNWYKNVRRIPLTVYHYKVFLRLNNRKKTQTFKDFEQTKYPHFELKRYPMQLFDTTEPILDWCVAQFGEFGFVKCGPDIWFKDEYDFLMFKMRWVDV